MRTTIDIEDLLGEEAAYLLEHRCEAVPAERVRTPGCGTVDAVFAPSRRPTRSLGALARLFGHGRLGGSGYLSLLPVDHGITRGAGNAFARNPAYFEPARILDLALEGGCSGVVTTLGVLGAAARRFAHRLPLVLKLDHDDHLTHPCPHENAVFGQVRQAADQGCVAVASTVYFGAPETRRRIGRVSEAFALAHELGLATILFCYLHPAGPGTDGSRHLFAADLTGQANYLGASIEADLVKQKLPLHDGGFRLPGYANGPAGALAGGHGPLVADHPIDLARYQVVNGLAGRAGLISSGGEAGGNDLRDAVRAAVINKRAGGLGLIAGRKVFQRPRADGLAVLHAIQDVYLNDAIRLA